MADEDSGNFGTDDDGAVTSTYQGGTSPDDFNSWSWKQIMAAIKGISAASSDDTAGFEAAQSVSDPSTLYDAADTILGVQQTLQMVYRSVSDQADALSGGDDAPWNGDAATAFNTMMDKLSRKIKANADVLSGGDSGTDAIPHQLWKNGQQLDTAIRTVDAIDAWYAQQAVALGVQPMGNGLIPVSQNAKIVEMLNHDMRQVITSLAGKYLITVDAVRNPDTAQTDTPNPDMPDPGGPGPDDPFGGGGNPFGDGPNADIGGGPGGGGTGDPSPFPGGGGTGDPSPFPGTGDTSPFPGGDGGLGGGPGGVDAAAFPGDTGLGGGGDTGIGPVTPFPGLGVGGDTGGLGDTGTSAPSLLGDPSAFSDPGLGDTSGLGGGAAFSGDTGLGGVGDGGVGELGGGVPEGGLGTDAPVEGFPGAAGAGNGMGSGMPMMPPGMGGGAPQTGADTKSDSSALLAPMPFPGGLGLDDVGLPGVLEGGGAAGGGEGLSGLDGLGDAAGMGGGVPPTTADTKTDASALLVPTTFPGDFGVEDGPMFGVLDDGGGLAGLEEQRQPATAGQSATDGDVVPGAGVLVPPPATTHRPVPADFLSSDPLPWRDSAHAETPPVPDGGDRVVFPHGHDAGEDFTAWEVAGGTAAAVLPWLFGREDKSDLVVASVSHDDKQWTAGDLQGVPERAATLATWRPERGGTGQAAYQGLEPRISLEDPDPEPEPEPANNVDSDEEEPERTSADLLARRSAQWHNRDDDLPGVLG